MPSKIIYKDNSKNLIRKVEKGSIQALFKVGAAVKTKAQNLIKTRSRSVQNVRELGGKRVRISGRAGSARVIRGRKYGQVSQLGEPHTTRKGLSRRAKAFFVDKPRAQVYIGSRASILGDVAGGLEKGGMFRGRNYGEGYPVMKTALNSLDKAGTIEKKFASII